MRSPLVLAALVALVAGAADARAAVRPAPHGCAMAHCDPGMTDMAGATAPSSVTDAWFDPRAASAAQGLGCSSNGAYAACTFGDRTGDRSRPYLVAYDHRGRELWNAGSALNAWAWTSVPIMTAGGDVVAADDASLVRFDRDGDVRWTTPTPGGAPISPTQTADGTIVLATSGGPVSAYDPSSGKLLASLELRDPALGVDGRFDTRNTPGSSGNRIYVSTELTLADGTMDPGRRARLYAIDVDPGAKPSKRLRVAWHFDFGARSGASPLVVGDLILFDGDRVTPDGPFAPRFFALRDRGDRPQLLWEYELGGPGVASAALDPRGGAWVFAFGNPVLRRLSLDDGRVVQEIDLDAAVGAEGEHRPMSAMTIAEGPGRRPLMLVSAWAPEGAHVAALDLTRGRALWTAPLPAGGQHVPMGQFPIVEAPGGTATVVFTTKGGVRGVTGPTGG